MLITILSSVFPESFYPPAAVLQIGDNTLNIPLDWSLVICDPEVGEPEVVNLMSLNDRGFSLLQLIPPLDLNPEFVDVQITNVYTDIKWYSPKLKFGHLLVVPIEDGDEPRCALFVKESNKIPKCWI